MPACSSTGVRFAASSASCAKRSKFGSNSLRWNGDGMSLVDAERDGVGLVAADQQTRAVGLVVHEVIGVAHRGHLPELDRRVALDRAAEQVLVLDSDRRDAHAGQLADLHAPHAGSVDHHLALDRVGAAIVGVELTVCTVVQRRPSTVMEVTLRLLA